MGKENVSKPTTPFRAKAKRAGLFTLGLLALATIIGIQLGYVGFGWAHLWAQVFPRDESMLAYVPRDTSAAVIFDPHQLDFSALGGKDGAARAWFLRTRDAIDEATGIDLALDVDKVVLTPSGVVARGRFDNDTIVNKLSQRSYKPVGYEGYRMLVRTGEDALVVIGNELLLYGDEASLKAAIDAKKTGASLEHEEPVTKRLRAVGWDHPLLVAVRMQDDRPSLRAILTGGTGPRAITIGASTKTGLDFLARIDAASPQAAEELKKLMDEKRQGAESLAPVLGNEPAAAVVGIAKRAKIDVDAKEAVVLVNVRVEPAELEALTKALAKAAPLAEFYKNVRLFQLLGAM